MRRHLRYDNEIAGRSSVAPRLPLAGHANARAAVDPRGNLNLRLIDWELVCRGDALYDVASWFGEYVRFWLTVGTYQGIQDPAEFEEARQRDPIDRVVKYLTSLGLWSEERQRTSAQDVAAEVDRAVEAAQRLDGVRPEMLFDNVYARPPRRIEKQRSQFLASVDGAGG